MTLRLGSAVYNCLWAIPPGGVISRLADLAFRNVEAMTTSRCWTMTRVLQHRLFRAAEEGLG